MSFDRTVFMGFVYFRIVRTLTFEIQTIYKTSIDTEFNSHQAMFNLSYLFKRTKGMERHIKTKRFLKQYTEASRKCSITLSLSTSTRDRDKTTLLDLDVVKHVWTNTKYGH